MVYILDIIGVDGPRHGKREEAASYVENERADGRTCLARPIFQARNRTRENSRLC